MRTMLVIGAGRFGRNLALKLESLGNEVLVVDTDEEAVSQLAPLVTRAQIGDCMSPDVLNNLGVRNFDVCFVCISENFQSSMEITSLLKELGAKYVVSKSDSDLHTKLLLKIGADEVVYPERDMAGRTATRFSAKGAFDYIELSPEYAIFEIATPKSWVGKTVKDLNVRSVYHINIIGMRDKGRIVLMTSAEHVFSPEEHLMIAGVQQDILKMMNRD